MQKQPLHMDYFHNLLVAPFASKMLYIALSLYRHEARPMRLLFLRSMPSGRAEDRCAQSWRLAGPIREFCEAKKT